MNNNQTHQVGYYKGPCAVTVAAEFEAAGFYALIVGDSVFAYTSPLWPE